MQCPDDEMIDTGDETEDEEGYSHNMPVEVLDESSADHSISDAPLSMDHEDDQHDLVEFEDDSIQGFFDHKVTGGADDKAFVWNVTSGKSLCCMGNFADSVVSVAFSYNGEYVAAGSMDGTVAVYNLCGENGLLCNRLEGPTEITTISWHPKGLVLVCGSSDGAIWMWSIPSGSLMNVFFGHASPITDARFSPDGKVVVSASDEGLLILWNPKTAEVLTKYLPSDKKFLTGSITCVFILSDSQRALIGSFDGLVRLVDIMHANTSAPSQAGKVLGSFDGHQGSVEGICLCSTLLPILVTAGMDGKVNFWDFDRATLRGSLQIEEAGITCMRSVDESPLFVTGSTDGVARLWDSRSGSVLREFVGHQQVILSLSINKQNQMLVTTSDDGVSLVFSLESPTNQ